MATLSQVKSKSGAKLLRYEMVITAAVLSLVVIAWTLYSVLNPGIDSTDRTVVGAAVLKDMQPALFPRDTLFANDEVYRYYTPLYRWIVARIWQWGGSFETGFIWLLPLVLGGYVTGMYLLLRQVTGHPWLALGLTVAAAHYHNVMGASGWGVGGSASLGARTLFMPAAPILALLLLRMLEKPGWRSGAVFGLLLGLATNLHPISGFHFLALSSAFLVLIYHRSYQGWQALAAAVLTTIVGASPVGWHFITTAGKPVAAGVTFARFSQIVAELYSIPFSPDTFSWPLFKLELTRPFLDGLVWFYLIAALFFLGVYMWGRWRALGPAWIRWSWLVSGLITVSYAQMIVLFETNFLFIVIGLYVVYRFWRGGVTRLDYWLLTFMSLIVLYSFVGYYLFAFAWQRLELWALTSFLTEFARSAALVYLPVYLLAGLAGVAWAGELGQRGWGGESHAAVAIAVVFSLTPTAVMHFADSLPLTLLMIGLMLLVGGFVLFIQQKVKFPWTTYLAVVVFVLFLFGPPASLGAGYFPVPTVNLLQADQLTPQPLYNPLDAELYDWVRLNTGPATLFYGCFGPVTMTHFRFRTQRSISHNWKDLTFNLHNRATLVPAYERFRQLEAGCNTPESIISTASSIKADYLLISYEKAATFLSEACFVNKRYAVFALKQNGCFTQ